MTTVTVTELILNFAEACRSLVPALDRAGVRWGDGEQYDNWDRIAEALFESLVTEPCAFQAVDEAGLTRLRIAPYGFASDAGWNAWVEVQGDEPARVVSLSSISKPFDHVRCEEPTGVIPLERQRFVFAYDGGDGTRRLERLNLAAE